MIKYTTILQNSVNSFSIFFTHTLQTLVGMLRDVSGRRWQTSQISSAE